VKVEVSVAVAELMVHVRPPPGDVSTVTGVYGLLVWFCGDVTISPVIVPLAQSTPSLKLTVALPSALAVVVWFVWVFKIYQVTLQLTDDE